MHSYQSSLLIHWWNSFSIPCLGCDNPSNHLPFISSPWQWEWILLSRVGFLCPAGHSLSGTHWCSPGQKHCWCSLDRWMEREREREKKIRTSERQTKLALWIIQHNPWDAERRNSTGALLHVIWMQLMVCCSLSPWLLQFDPPPIFVFLVLCRENRRT